MARGKIMSLPSKALFYKDGVKVAECFVNCGWFYQDTIPFIQRLLKELEYPDCDWNELNMYNKRYSRKLVKWILTYVEEV
jgi:hypothetical protein